MSPDPSKLRDSTQIVLPCGALDGIRSDLENKFTVSIRCEKEWLRIIGSPVEIKNASDFLSRHGITVQ